MKLVRMLGFLCLLSACQERRSSDSSSFDPLPLPFSVFDQETATPVSTFEGTITVTDTQAQPEVDLNVIQVHEGETLPVSLLPGSALSAAGTRLLRVSVAATRFAPYEEQFAVDFEAQADASGNPRYFSSAPIVLRLRSLVPWGDQWITRAEMETLRAAERLQIGWDFAYKITTAHYVIYSTATLEQTYEIGGVAEALFTAYENFVGPHYPLTTSSPFKTKLFGTRDEFRTVVLGGSGWAEGLYDFTYTNMYYDATAPNPYHWFLHEATHQLDYECARFYNAQWLEEGLACYFGTSRYSEGVLHLGDWDPDTYPAWWLSAYQNRAVIPLRDILNGTGPDINTYFNLYYLQWWSLVHFLFNYDGGRYRDATFTLLGEGGTATRFRSLIGDPDLIHPDWYAYLNSGVPVPAPSPSSSPSPPPAASSDSGGGGRGGGCSASPSAPAIVIPFLLAAIALRKP